MTTPTEQEIELKKFDMRKVGDEKICVFIGKCGDNDFFLLQ